MLPSIKLASSRGGNEQAAFLGAAYASDMWPRRKIVDQSCADDLARLRSCAGGFENRVALNALPWRRTQANDGGKGVYPCPLSARLRVACRSMSASRQRYPTNCFSHSGTGEAMEPGGIVEQLQTIRGHFRPNDGTVGRCAICADAFIFRLRRRCRDFHPRVSGVLRPAGVVAR